MPTVSYVNDVLATYSDYSYRTALVLYLVAMVAHLGEYARVRAAAEPVRVAVPAGAPAGEALAAGHTAAASAGAWPAEGPGRPRRSRAERSGRTAVALTVLAAALHVASLALRGAAVVRWPWGNMYEFTSAICAVAVLGWLVLLARAGDRAASLRRVGAFVLLPVVVLMFLAGTVLYADAAPVMPALRSYWLAVHVTAASVASGLLLIAGVASVLFLVRGRRPDDAPGLIGMLPTRETLDRVAYRVTVVAFPIWTFAIMTGAIWAEAAWGRFWGWDPKETVAFVAWVVYAGYLHARATAGWRGGGAAWVSSVGFAVMLFNLFFVNLVTTGLHSYAGVS
jgi:cytochrome c-type biogenesis protein CcsB